MFEEDEDASDLDDQEAERQESIREWAEEENYKWNLYH